MVPGEWSHRVKFVFEVIVDDDYAAERYARAWVEASRIIQRSTGACGTYLHRDLNDPRRLLAIATWASREARDSAETARTDAVRRIIEAQAAHVRVNVIGEFDDPEWSVVPGA